MRRDRSCNRRAQDLGLMVLGARLACCVGIDRSLDHGGQKIVTVLVWIVGFVGIPFSPRKLSLPCHCATLHMHAVDKAVLDIRRSPIPTSDHPAALCELSRKRKIAFPGRLSLRHAHNIASQAIVGSFVALG